MRRSLECTSVRADRQNRGHIPIHKMQERFGVIRGVRPERDLGQLVVDPDRPVQALLSLVGRHHDREDSLIAPGQKVCGPPHVSAARPQLVVLTDRNFYDFIVPIKVAK